MVRAANPKDRAAENPNQTLLELAERCEQATGPDQELDGYIYTVARKGFGCTRSVDAAITLVPEGKVWNLRFDPRGSLASVEDQNGLNQHHAMADSPALAIAAAALRARAAL